MFDLYVEKSQVYDEQTDGNSDRQIGIEGLRLPWIQTPGMVKQAEEQISLLIGEWSGYSDGGNKQGSHGLTGERFDPSRAEKMFRPLLNVHRGHSVNRASL